MRRAGAIPGPAQPTPARATGLRTAFLTTFYFISPICIYPPAPGRALSCPAPFNQIHEGARLPRPSSLFCQ